MIILALLFPLSHAALGQIDHTLETEAKREVVHKEEVRLKDTTVIHSEPDAVLGRNCVATVRHYRPDAPSMNAIDYPISTTTPSVGAIGKMHYGAVGHVFYTLEVREDTLKIVDGGYDYGYITVRVIPKNDPRIFGYLSTDSS